MKNKGFTLIELLAVIVILAIIAIIAVPIILNIINDSKKSSDMRSVELYGKAIENAVGNYQVKNPHDTDITLEKVQPYIKYKGNKVECTTTKINKDGTVYLSGCKVSGKDVEYTYGISKDGGNTGDSGDEGYADTTGAKVDMLSGLTPVVYADNNWKVADTSSKWYDYSNQEWANAVILKTGVSKNTGDIVDVVSEVTAMLVYIPRYEYKIDGQYGKGGTSVDAPGEIEVNFISKDTTTPSTGYIVHPAFTFGSEELNGIWVGKFETSHTTLSSSTTENNLGCSNENCANADGLLVLPNVPSLRYNNVSNFFYAARSMTRSGNPFGLSQSNADTHMMKNSEWGAVAYLSQSKYGKYGNTNYSGAEKQVRINNCSNFITGIGANSQNEAKSTSTCTTNTYETANGQAASTTGNITGVYDMSGGSWEYVMGVYNQTISDSGFSTLPDAKYYDNYTTTTATTACSSGICYGHALSETSGWYGDSAHFVSEGVSWFIRGGFCYISADAGVFGFYSHNGSSDPYSSFRVVLSQTTN